MRSKEFEANKNHNRECLGCLTSILLNLRIPLSITKAFTHLSVYARYFVKRFLCVKNGDRYQTSVSFTVLAVAIWNIGSTNETVIQDQRVTLSSGMVRSLDGTYEILKLI